MERHDERSRAHPEPEDARRDEAMPAEGPAAVDASRDYTDAGEGSEAGRDEAAEARRTQEGPLDRPNYAAREQPAGAVGTADVPEVGQETRGYGGTDAPAATAAPGTYDARGERPAGDPAEGQAYDTAATRSGTAGTAEAQAPSGAATEHQAGEQTAVLSPDDAKTFQGRWETIQGTFIDDPHAATEQADALVGEVMDRLASLRAEYLRQLRGAIGDGSDTEAMRVALQRYRAFFLMLIE